MKTTDDFKRGWSAPPSEDDLKAEQDYMDYLEEKGNNDYDNEQD